MQNSIFVRGGVSTYQVHAGSDWPGGRGGVPPQAPCLIKFIRIDIDLYIR